MPSSATPDHELPLRAIFDATNDAMLIVQDNLYVEVNRAAERLFGVSRDQLLGQDATTFGIESFDLEAATVAFRRDGRLGGEIVIRRPDGSLRHGQFESTANVQPGRHLSVIRDITSQKEAETALAQSERRYRLLVESSTDVVYITDPGTFRYVSPAMKTVFGYEPSELVGVETSSLVHPEDRQLVREALAAALITPAPRPPVMFRGQHKDGSYRFIEAVGRNMLDEPSIRGVVVTLRDVSEREATESARRAAERLVVDSERRFRLLVESGTDVVCVIAKGKIIYVSPSIQKVLGYTPDEFVTIPRFEVCHPDDRALAIATNQRVMRSGPDVSVEIELRLLHKNGEYRHVALVGRDFSDEPSIRGAVVNFHDVTERKRADRAEQTLLETEEQLRQAQKLEALGQLAGGVAHDFNNILSVILGYTSIIIQELDADDPKRNDIEQIHEAGVRASELTRQLLSFSRKAVLQPRVVELNTVIGMTRRILQRLLGEDIDLQILEHPGPTSVHADPGQLEQVIINLAVNARDAMPSGGQLRIETGRVVVSPARAEHMGTAPGDHVVMTVSDDGVGMDAAVLAHIFEPFFTTKEKGKGTGLGLSTVFGIVKQSAGHVTVTSNPGQGSTFRVLLPAIDAGADEAPVAQHPIGTERASGIILLVEDEAQVRRLASTILRRAGYDILTAADGEEALSVAAAHDGVIHLLLTDVVMPRLGGHPLAERLRELRPGLPVLFMSGYTDDTVLRHGVELGELAFLPKPFTPQALLAKVRALLELAHRPSG